MSASLIVRSIILASPANTALAGRVHLVVAPQNATLPHAVIIPGGERRNRALAGTEPLTYADVSIAIKAGNASDAEQIGRQVSAALVDAAGVHSGAPYRIFHGNGGSSDFIEKERAHRRLIVCEVVIG